MTLTYRRQESGDHTFVDEAGKLRLWRGAAAWYFSLHGSVTRLCPLEWSDGEAIQLFHARRRLGR